LKTTVEALLVDERKLKNLKETSERDYTIKYVDKDDEKINVSDDEDLLTAYEVAETELSGNLKFVVEWKPAPKVSKDTLKKEKKEAKAVKKVEKKLDKKAKKLKSKKARKDLEEEKVTDHSVIEKSEPLATSFKIINDDEEVDSDEDSPRQKA
jgi:hypothetical protein